MANERTDSRLATASLGPGFFGVILLFCGFAVVAWILFQSAAPSQTYEDKRAQTRRDKVAVINKEAQDKLYSQAKWIDQAKGTVQLPIDTAMDLIVADYQQKTVQASAVKVETPYPAGLGLKDETPAAPVSPAAPETAAPAPAPAASVTTEPVAAPAAPAATTEPAASPTSASPAPR